MTASEQIFIIWPEDLRSSDFNYMIRLEIRHGGVMTESDVKCVRLKIKPPFLCRDSGNNQDLMRGKFRAQNLPLFSSSIKSLLIFTICKSYVYTLIRSWKFIALDSLLPVPDEA